MLIYFHAHHRYRCCFLLFRLPILKCCDRQHKAGRREENAEASPRWPRADGNVSLPSSFRRRCCLLFSIGKSPSTIADRLLAWRCRRTRSLSEMSAQRGLGRVTSAYSWLTWRKERLVCLAAHGCAGCGINLQVNSKESESSLLSTVIAFRDVGDVV
jgi:hypothetical protein